MSLKVGDRVVLKRTAPFSGKAKGQIGTIVRMRREQTLDEPPYWLCKIRWPNRKTEDYWWEGYVKPAARKRKAGAR